MRRRAALAVAVVWLLAASPAGATPTTGWASSSSGAAAAQATVVAPPGTLTATCSVLLSAAVQLDWLASASPFASYEVRWGTTSGGPYTTSSGIVAGLSYTTPGLGAGTYYFVVRSAATSWRSSDSNQQSKTVVSILGLGLLCA
jgi:hypothetical protein